jgi:hypothetical protein
MSEGITVTHGVAAALGAAIIAAGRVLFGAVLGAKDKQIAVLEAEVARLHGVVAKLGEKHDAKDRELRDAYVRMATAAQRGRREPDQPEDFEDMYPTAVRNMLDLVSSRRPEAARQDRQPDQPARAGDPLPELAGWDPTQSTPPGQYDPPVVPRGRLPSRPR